MTAALKRPAASSAAKASTKRAKKVDPLLEKKDLIIESVNKASMYSDSVLKMLLASLDHGLFTKRESRHSIQQEVIEMFQQVLEKVEEAAKAKVEESNEQMKTVEAERNEKASVVEAAEVALKVKAEALTSASAAVKEAKDAKNVANKKVSEAERAQKAGLKEAMALEGKKAATQESMEHFEHLVDGSVGYTKKNFQLLTKCLKQCGAESQIIESCQMALSKTPEDRAPFDKVIVESIAELLKKALAEVQAKIDAEETTKAELLGAVALANSESEAITAKWEDAKDLESVAKVGVAEAESLLEEAQKAQADFAASIEELEASNAEVVANLAAASEAIAAFEALESGVEPVAAAEVEEAVVEAAAETDRATA